MKKLIITEEEKNHIRNLHEQKRKLSAKQLGISVDNTSNTTMPSSTTTYGLTPQTSTYVPETNPENKTENLNPKNLKVGDGGKNNPQKKNDVIELQNKLISLGCLKTDTGKATGYFGSKTDAALKLYQTKGSCKSTVDSKVKDEKKPIVPETKGTLDKNSSLLFDGDYLYWMASGKEVKKWKAHSGLTWKNSKLPTSDELTNMEKFKKSDWGRYLYHFFQNKEDWSKEKLAGPLPKGNYIVGPLETRDGDLPEISAWEAAWNLVRGKLTSNNQDFYKNTLESRIGWGNHRLPIKPAAGTDTYQRGGFYIHGGSIEGSHGCIDLTDQMSDFAKDYAAWSSLNKMKKMNLTVQYNKSVWNWLTDNLLNLDKGESFASVGLPVNQNVA